MVDHERERQECLDLGFEGDVFDVINGSVQAPLSRLTLKGSVQSYGFDESLFPGQIEPGDESGVFVLSLDVLSALVPEDDARDITLSLQSQLGPRGYQVLVTARNHMDFCHIFQVGTGLLCADDRESADRADHDEAYHPQQLVGQLQVEFHVPNLLRCERRCTRSMSHRRLRRHDARSMRRPVPVVVW